MRFAIDDAIFGKYPDAVIGIAVARDINNQGENAEVMQMLRQQEAQVRHELQLETLAQSPLIQNWRQAYRQFGEKDDRASHEALMRRVLKGGSLRHINTLVDCYNCISLKYRTPVGGEDMEKITGDIRLKFAEGTEPFVALGSSEVTHPAQGEVVYTDNREVLCRKWNWRESDRTKLTEATRSAVLVIEMLPPLTEQDMKAALNGLAALVGKHCGAETQTFVVTKESKKIEF
ncbi:MAG: hypothetical protein HYY37_01165 [Candidatus Aenigmarchaeota archaeon]|nr:hypothetical protein [Candidatus Aenigmarchaeota archaeon]